MILIVDASVVAKWLLAEAGADRAAALMRHPLVAPETLVPECLGALRKRVLRGLMLEQDAYDAALILARAGIVFEPVLPLAPEILSLSLRLSLSTYDCAYLALARKVGGILVTADERLLSRCRKPDVADLGLQVRSLFDPEAPKVRERPPRPYIARRKAA